MTNYFQGKKRWIIYFIFIFLGFLITITILLLMSNFSMLEKKEVIQKIEKSYLSKAKAQEKVILQKINISDNLKSTVDGESFLAIDLESGKKIFSKNEKKIFGIASLTKIATAYTYLENLNTKDNLNNNDEVVILKKNLRKLGNDGLSWGERFIGRDLVKLMMVTSSNDASSALTNSTGREYFIEYMNHLASNLELNSTLFFSESGLDVSDNILGSYSSAENIARLVEHFYKKYPKLSSDFSINRLNICSNIFCHNAKNTNKLLFEEEKCIKFSENDKDICLESKIKKYPHKVLFSKTGFTRKSGGSIVMIVEILNHKILIVVLNSGKNTRFSDMEKISNSVEEYLKIN